MHGTSVAAAHVAGVAALVMGALPGLSATEARARIEARTFRLGDPSLVGAGLVDAAAAVGAVAVSDPSVYAPNAPTGLAAKLISVTEVGLTWADNSSNEDGFELQYRQPGGGWQPAGVLAELKSRTVRRDAESLYDTLLRVAGRLDTTMFGPGDAVDVRPDGLVTPAGTARGFART